MKKFQKMMLGLFAIALCVFAFLPMNRAQSGGGTYPSFTVKDENGYYHTFCPSADPNGSCSIEM